MEVQTEGDTAAAFVNPMWMRGCVWRVFAPAAGSISIPRLVRNVERWRPLASNATREPACPTLASSERGIDMGLTRRVRGTGEAGFDPRRAGKLNAMRRAAQLASAGRDI